MLVAPNNSNNNVINKHFSQDSRQTNATSLLLKPTGVPVFVSIDQQKQNTNVFSEQSTLESVNEMKLQRTVRATSFVIGKKIQNQTGLDLLGIESSNGVTDKQFPVKIIYQKPSYSQKQYMHKGCAPHEHHDNKEEQENDMNSANSNGKVMKIDKSKIHLKQDFPKTNAVSDLNKISEVKHRPKSATTQQLKKDQVKRTKLGPNNTKIKPQVSYIGKVQLKKRPQTAQKSQERVKQIPKKEEDPVSPQATNIPFAHNRFQGQPKSNNMTKELLKKAQDKIKEEKQLIEKQKQDVLIKKEKEKQLQDDVRKMNQEITQIQKEKGVERVDFRKKEEEHKDKQRREENKQERDKRVEMRKKRKEDGRKILGLDIFDEKYVDEKMKKIKEQQLAQQQLDQNNDSTLKKPMVEQQQMFKVKQPREQSSNPMLFHNKDLKEIIKEEQKAQEEEEEQKVIDKKKLLKEQKQKRKQDQLEKQKQDEQERLKKFQNIQALEDKLRQQKDEYFKKKEFQQKVMEEKERLKKEMAEQPEEKQKKHKKKKSKTENELHKEKIDELKNWIEEQMQREDLKEVEEDEPSQSLVQKESQQIRMEPLIKVKIDKKVDKQQPNNDINQMKLMKHALPGNHMLAEKEESKLGPRQNRYGVYGDNGYDKIVEIKRQKYEDKTPKQQSKQPQNVKDTEVIEQLPQAQVEEEDDHQIINIEKEIIEQPSRKIVIDKQAKKSTEESKQRTLKNIEKLFPGVLNVEKELQRQKKEKELKDVGAAKVIQKWTRGLLGRMFVRNLREKKRTAIEEQYGYFQDQVKFNQDYNLEKFLRDKKKLREKNSIGMSSDIISENIGMDHSGSNKFQTSGNNYHQQQQTNEVKVQNYFKEPSDRDPLSIISIFAKLHAPVNQHQSNQQKQSQKHKNQGRGVHLLDSNSDIVEDIYTENFDEDQGSDMGQRRITSNEDIEEDILEGSKGAQSSMGSGGNKHLLQLPNKQNQQIKQGHFNYKPASSIGGSISEDIMVSVEKRSKRSPGGADDSSIAEESHLQEMSGSKNSSTTKRQRQYEESIREEVEGSQAAYEDEAFDSYSGSIAFQKQKQQQQIQGKKEIEKFEIKMKESEGLRKEKLNEMLEEIKKYEQASVSTVVVERMEKIINMSLHQKDKLVLASRLHELEMEKQHKDEINKIREEQIKLMSQLMLMGNQSQMNEQDKKAMLEQINKIIDKPVTIVQQKLYEERKSPQSSDNAFEEKEEQDYIQESRSLKQINNKSKKRDNDYDDSIQESLPDHMSNSDDIAEDIPDHTDTDNMSKMSEDEIKESVYADGQKMQDQKKYKEGSNNNELHKMRLTLGSEEAIRKQSKKTFDKSGQGKKENGQSGLFEKSSFEDFTHQKFKELMLDDNNAMFIKEYLEQLEAFQEREHKKKQELQHDLKKNLISPRTYSRKTKELEKWVDEQKSELQDKKIKQVANYQEINQFLNKLDTDKKMMIQKIGSPRQNKRLMDSNSQASLDYDDIEEDSNESMRVKLARNQIGQISHEMSKHQHKDKKVEAKMATAKKLLADKQKAIDEGIKEKLRDIESEHADQLLNAALKLDINAEIQKRIKGAQRLVEESNQSELDNYDSVRSIEESKQLNKKHVQFAGSAEKYSPSVYSNMDSSGGPSIRKQPTSNRFADSIDESIKIEESYNASQSIQPMSESRKTVSDRRVATSQSAIQESIREEDKSGKYSDDFVEESLVSDKKKSSLRGEQFKPNKSEDRFSSNHKIEEDSIDKDIDYSMNFDESIGNSQQLPIQTQQSQSQKVKEMDIVNEESESNQDKSLSQNNRYQSNEEEEEEDIVEESVTSQSMMSSQKNQQLSSMGGQEASQSYQHDEEQSEYDKEIVQSSQSVEWKIQLEKPETHRSSHRQTDEDKYSEDFEELEDGEDKDIDNLEDLESCPDEIEQSNDQEKQIDRITEEFMQLVLNQIQGDISEIKGLEKADVDQFEHKFPFNLEIQQQKQQQQVKEEKKEEKKQIQDVINVVVNKQPAKSNEELSKERFEQQQKQIQESHKAVEQYLDLIIKNIDRKELINQLEKPIENDPLKILARIQAVEYDESQSFNNLNESLFGQQQFILSLDQFKLIENLYRAKNSDRASLTESGEQRKLTYENFHHKAVFDAFNDALDYERPYKMKGEPNPWSKQTRQIRPKITTAQAEKILEKGKNKVLAWAKTGAGTKCAPLPPPPPMSSEFDAPSQQPPQVSEEERRNQVREEKLGELLTKEIEEGDQLWVDYENEDTQTKFDLADMILQDLANEIAAFLISKLQ